ncbi:MAG TPA: hypothetical protein DCO79_07895 [Spirochaeta sp.]|nr:hypothetical protein [Spirochaeta sp.]
MVLRPAIDKAAGLKILITAILLVFLITLLFPVRIKLSEIITDGKIRTIEMLEEQLDHKITYSSIAPSILHAFEIRDFAVLSKDTPHTPLLEIEKLRLSFNIFKFRLDDPMNAFNGLLLVNSELNYDSSRNEELINVLKKLTDNSSTSGETASDLKLPDDFLIRGRNISINVNTEDFSTELSRIFFTLERSPEDDLIISLKADSRSEITSLPENLPFNQITVDTGLKLNGRIDSKFKWTDLNIRTKDFNTDFVSFNKLALNFRYEAPGIITIVKTGDSIPVDISITANMNTEEISLGLRAQDFVFNHYFEPRSLLSDYSNFLDASISGEASLFYVLRDNDLEYSGDLEINNIAGLLETPIDAVFILEGKQKFIRVSESRILSDSGRVDFSGTIDLDNELPIINGRIDIPGLRYKDLSMRSNLLLSSTREAGYKIQAGRTTINGLSLSNLNAEFAPYDENIEFTVSADVNTSAVSSDHIFTEGIIQLGEQYYVQTSLNIDSLLLAPVLAAVPVDISLPEVLEDIQLTTEMFISGSLEQLSFASPLISLNDRSSKDRSLAFSLAGNNSGFRLSDLDLHWDENYLTGKLSSDLSDTGDLRVHTSLDFNGAAINTAGVYSSKGNLSLTGDYGLKLNLFSIGEANSFSLKTERLPLNTVDSTSFLSLNIAGFFTSINNWKLLINDISVDALPTGFGSGNMNFAAILSQDGGNIYKLRYSDDQSELAGGGSIMLTGIQPIPSGRLHLNLSSTSRDEDYSMLIGFNDGELEGNIDFSGFPIRRAVETSPVDGGITGNISIAGTLSSPQLRLQLNTRNASMNGERIIFKAAMYYEDLKLQLDELSATYGEYHAEDIKGIFNLDQGSHTIEGNLSTESNLLKFNALFDINAETVTISSIRSFADILADDYNAGLTINDIILNEESKEAWYFSFVKREKLFNINGGTDNEIACSFFGDGYFSLEADAPFPAQISASGTIHDGNINAEINSISYVFDNLEMPALAFYEGDFTGKLRLQGPLNDPDFYGQIDFHDIVFKAPFVEDITEAFDTSFFFSGKDLTMPATRTRTTNGLVNVIIEASMERWLPRNYDLKINIPKGEAISGLLYFKPFYANCLAEGYVHLSGTFSHMYIDGNVNVSKGVFMLTDTMEKRKKGKNQIEFVTCDLDIVTKENNQFFWPNQDRPILESLLSSENKLNILFDTTDGLLLNGDLSLKSGEIFYFERNFYIKEGEIAFNNETFSSMDPLLSTRAEIRDINSEGEMTKIYLIVDPSPLSSFTPRFESEPPMSTAEIISIIGGNIFDTFDSDNFILQDAALVATDVLAQFAIMRNIEDGLKSTLGLDLLSIRSSFFSNFLENTLFSSSGEGNTGNFTDYLDNTTLFLGKYFSDDIFLQGMFQFDLYNDTGYSEDLNMNIDSEIKLEWEGPVANVELNFYPDFQNPIEGLNKTSLGLSWRFSY